MALARCCPDHGDDREGTKRVHGLMRRRMDGRELVDTVRWRCRGAGVCAETSAADMAAAARR
eukprot:757379-Hanusia_phi.AAC.9